MVLPVVTSAAASPLSAAAPAASAAPARLDAFDAALARHAEPGATAPVTAANGAPAAPVEAPHATGRAEALDRARAGFGLEPGAPATPARGDMILEGMQKLRGIFDASQTRVGAIMDRSSVDAGSLMQMQLELTNFTLLVDMSSKLTGKTTQVFDTLMKGQ